MQSIVRCASAPVCLLLVCLLNPLQGGNLYVGSYQSNRILQYGAVTGVSQDRFGFSAPVAAGSGLNGPELITFGPDGNLYAPSFNSDKVFKFDGTTGALIATYSTGQDTEPSDVTFGPDGNLYVALLTSVVRLNPATGTFSPFAIAGAAFGIRFGPDGNLYATTGANDVEKFAGPFSTNPTPGSFLGKIADIPVPNGLAFGPDGSLYVASFSTNSVFKIVNPDTAPSSSTLTTGVVGDPNDLTSPVGLTFGPDGALYVASSGTDEVLKYDPLMGTFLGALVTAGNGGLVDPEGLAFGPDLDGPSDTPFLFTTFWFGGP